MKKLFTERRDGSKARLAEALDASAKQELLLLVFEKFEADWFGYSFPWKCSDGDTPFAGTNDDVLRKKAGAYGIPYPRDLANLREQEFPSDDQTFDLIEFSFEVIAEPTIERYHSFLHHNHYEYDQEAGRATFTAEVNRILERHGIAFELRNGEVVRIGPVVLHSALSGAVFKTGDRLLNELLDSSREKFLNRSLAVRKEALEKLWDAWERLKSLEYPSDKKRSAGAILDKASTEVNFRGRLESEARELTEIGNRFMIRHTEIDKVPITEPPHIDYLFHRLFALIELLLRKSGRL